MVIGAMSGVALRFVLLLCFRSSVAANSGRVHYDMSTLAPFVVDPGAVLGASPSMHGVVTPVMMDKTCAIGWRYGELQSILVGLLRCCDDGCDALPRLARPATDGGWPLGLLSG